MKKIYAPVLPYPRGRLNGSTFVEVEKLHHTSGGFSKVAFQKLPERFARGYGLRNVAANHIEHSGSPLLIRGDIEQVSLPLPSSSTPSADS
jgi:hypothetical protein